MEITNNVSTLWEKSNYLNKDIPYIISKEITEYDIRSAGFNIIKRYGLVDSKRLQLLHNTSREHRHVLIGLWCKDDKELSAALGEGFKDIRKSFFIANEIVDSDILSIKKDAIITTKHCDVCEFDNIEFVPKNRYTSYFYLNKIEFYVGRYELDVKGINDEKLKLHRQYMLDFLFRVFKMLETTNTLYVIKQVKSFAEHYKNRTLDIGYYRELNVDSLFKLKKALLRSPVGVSDVDDVKYLDIRYNYINYIIALINILA